VGKITTSRLFETYKRKIINEKTIIAENSANNLGIELMKNCFLDIIVDALQ
jgi:hypothetical protein